MHHGRAVLVIPPAQPPGRFGRWLALLKKHVHEHGCNHGKVGGLLRNRRPRVDASDGEHVENEPGGEERRRYTPFVATDEELEALETAIARRGYRRCSRRSPPVVPVPSPASTGRCGRSARACTARAGR